VSEIAQNLERYKWEIGNCQTAARRLRDEEARLDRESNEKLDLAERAEAAAKQLEQEAARYIKLSLSVILVSVSSTFCIIFSDLKERQLQAALGNF